MKRLISLLPLLILTSCAWIATHPKEDEVIIESIEEGVLRLYEYETRTLSPGVPPHKIMGPTGPTKK